MIFNSSGKIPGLARFLSLTASIAVLAGFPVLAVSADEKPLVLITNVNVFDGKSDELAMNSNVLIEGNLIKEVGENLTAAGCYRY